MTNSTITKKSKALSNLFVILAAGFFLFLLWIIYLANTGGSSIFFDLIRNLPFGDKIGHFGLFGVSTLLFNLATRCKTFNAVGINVYWGTIGVTIFVLIEELSQGFIDSRTLDIYDLLADFVGIFTFSVISFLISKMFVKYQI